MPTTVTFWDQMGAYNEATLPVQILMVVVAVVLTYFVFAKASARGNTLMKMFLSFAFAWNGIVFFLIFARSPISTFFGAPLFIIVAILFAMISLLASSSEFDSAQPALSLAHFPRETSPRS